MNDGSVTLKTIDSPINGKLTVKWDLLNGYQIMGGGLWQVGGPVETVWRSGIKVTKGRNLSVSKALILGVGGGTTAKLIRETWTKCEIVGVDIDPEIVKLGEEYLGLKKINVKLHIADAFQFSKNDKGKYDLICVDTYVGSSYPEKLASIEFLTQVKELMNNNGIVIFNRIFGEKDHKKATEFESKLKTQFGNVMEKAPSQELVNIIYVCSVPIIATKK